MKPKNITKYTFGSAVLTSFLLGSMPSNLVANAEESINSVTTQEEPKEEINDVETMPIEAEVPTISPPNIILDDGFLSISTNEDGGVIYYKLDDGEWTEYKQSMQLANVKEVKVKVVAKTFESETITKEVSTDEVHEVDLKFDTNLAYIKGSEKDAYKLTVDSKFDLEYYYARGSYSEDQFSNLEKSGMLNDFEDKVSYFYYGGEYTVFGVLGDNVVSEVIKITDLPTSDSQDKPYINEVYNVPNKDGYYNVSLKFKDNTTDWFYTLTDGGKWVKYGEGDLITAPKNSIIYTKYTNSQGEVKEQSIFLEDTLLEKSAKDVEESFVEKESESEDDNSKEIIEEVPQIESTVENITENKEVPKQNADVTVKSTDVIYANETLPKTGNTQDNYLYLIGGLTLTLSLIVGSVLISNRRKVN